MQKWTLSMLIVPPLLLAACGSELDGLAEAASTPLMSGAAGTTSVTIAYQTRWQGGYCADVFVKNGGGSALSTWSVGIHLGGASLTQLWSATSTVSSGVLLARPLSYNAQLAPGASASFGYCVSAASWPAEPSVVSVNGAGVSAPSGGTGATGGTTAGTGGTTAGTAFVCPTGTPPDPALETMTVTREYTTTSFSNLADNSYTPILTFKGNTYFVWLDGNRRPMLGKISPTGTTTRRLDPNDDYRARDDGHHKFSLGIDRSGYLHVVGDMHHYPSSNVDHLPSRYLGGGVMYWVSNRPEDISAFTWVGKDTARAVPGYGFSYCAFQHDVGQDLYLNCRVKVHKLGHRTGEMGFGVFRYDATTKTWSALGGLAPNATYRAVAWEDNGHAGTFYQGLRGSLRFDCRNRMHVVVSLNNDNTLDAPSDVIYAYSDDEGKTFRKASGAAIASLPLRVEAGAAQADVIYHGLPSIHSYVFFDRAGTPAGTYEDGGVARYSRWDPATKSWLKGLADPLAGGIRHKHHLDRKGMLTFIDAGRLLRKTSFSAGGRTFNIPYRTFTAIDELGLRETNVFRGIAQSTDQSTMYVLKVVFK